jgi:hypothetical protein
VNHEHIDLTPQPLNGTARLNDLAKQINEAAAAAEGSARSAMQYAIRTGTLLNDAKALVPHGQWDHWLCTNCALAARTAQAYMRLVNRLRELPPEEAQRVADLPVREAVRAIATAPEAPARARAISIKSRTDRDRAVQSFKDCADALRKAVPFVGCGGLDARRVQSLRAKLMAALAVMDQRTETIDVQVLAQEVASTVPRIPAGNTTMRSDQPPAADGKEGPP